MSGQEFSKFGQACPRRLIRFLRAAHPLKCAESVAEKTGVPVSTVRKWIDGSSAPGFKASWALIGAYGPSIIAAVFEIGPKWADDAWRQQKMDDLQARRAAIEDELRSLSGR